MKPVGASLIKILSDSRPDPQSTRDLNPIPVIVFKCIEILIAILIINKCALYRPFSQALRYDRASYIHATVVQINIKARSYHKTCGEINYPNFHIKQKRIKNSSNKLSNFHIAFSVKQKHCMHTVCISQEKTPSVCIYGAFSCDENCRRIR